MRILIFILGFKGLKLKEQRKQFILYYSDNKPFVHIVV